MRTWLIIAALGCHKDSTPPPAATPPPVGSAVPAPPAGCDFAGDYRLRFHSNGTDGWWLRLRVAGTPPRAEIVAKANMLDFEPGPIQLVTDPATCKATLTKTTNQAGDVKLQLVLDPKTGAITGELARTKNADDAAHASTPITGRRDVGPVKNPACFKPGIYDVAVDPKAPWKLSEGHPRVGGCKDFADLVPKARVRIEALGDAITFDEIARDSTEQSFGRGEVTRSGDCAIAVKLEIQDLTLDAKLTFAGDKVDGRATTARYQFMEDGTAGENLWACKVADAPLVIKRIAD